MRKILKISILGYGISGKAAERLARSKGYEVSVFDDNPHLEELPSSHKLEESDIIVASPGVRPESEFMKNAEKFNIPIISEIEFTFRHCRNPIIAITGTNGKTTTTELANGILKSAGIRSECAGNIGFPLSEAVVNTEDERTVLVTELSSFQLERCFEFAPRAAALLNISSDHMDRYKSLDEYAQAKLRIFKNISNPEKKVLRYELAGKYNMLPALTFSPDNENADFHLRKNRIFFRDREILKLDECLLKGLHNAENIMAAMALCGASEGFEILDDENVIAFIKNFKAGEHRLENLAEKNGILYVNDSKATNPDSTARALECLGSESNICLILGGLDKEMDFSILKKYSGKIKGAFVCGQCARKIFNTLKNDIPCTLYGNFDDAVIAACKSASTGDVVLLSPGCASMDAFENYRKRGEKFRSIVIEFLEKTEN